MTILTTAAHIHILRVICERNMQQCDICNLDAYCRRTLFSKKAALIGAWFKDAATK